MKWRKERRDGESGSDPFSPGGSDEERVMGQLKEVRQKQWREGAWESLLSIGKDDGWKGRELLLLSQRPSGLLEPNKCGRKKSKLAAREESPSEVATTPSLRDVRSWIH